MRTRMLLSTLAGLGLMAACSGPLPDVRGFQAPPGARIVGELQASSALTADMPAGSASYVGASADGSLLGFLTADGFLRWYRVR